MITDDFKQKFLFNSDDTGRFIVKSLRTNISYFVEPIDTDIKTYWGDYNPATKSFETANYGSKFKGSVSPKESMITPDNGFDRIHTLKPGQSPIDYINKIDDEYYIKLSNKNNLQ